MPQRLLPVNFDPTEMTIADIHQGYRNGTLTCEQLVRAYLSRIAAYDQPNKLNAIVVINAQALETARELDKEFRVTGKLRPLHGIPIIVKDNFNTIGLQTSAGSLAMKGFIPGRDAWQVKKIKAAGAIVLAKANMAEWAFSPKVTISSLAGETLNPYNLAHVPAGSSGGTAAAVAASFGTVGLGSDTGNSIRGPSAHTALVGFRSTLGLTSRYGIVPLYLRNDVGGPMARTVADAVCVLEVIAGYDPQDPLTEHCRGKVPENYRQFLMADGLQGARVGVLRILSEKDVHPQIKVLFEKAILDIRVLGAEIVDPVVIPGFAAVSANQWCSTFKADINDYLSVFGRDAPVKNFAEIIASGKFAGYIKEDLEYFAANSGRDEKPDSPCLDVYNDPKRIAFRQAIEQVMDSLKLDALIYPTWNQPPAKVGDFSGYRGDNSQLIAPHTGQPAFTVPMGFTSGNLPAGLQFLGRMFSEPTLIRIAYAYEQGTRHRKPPELFPPLAVIEK
ncbi:MAG TPA: amidase family protein [Patescibacteria group bacterium]|nr:amidase family protein [Patescibacteria group bacterium]